MNFFRKKSHRDKELCSIPQKRPSLLLNLKQNEAVPEADAGADKVQNGEDQLQPEVGLADSSIVCPGSLVLSMLYFWVFLLLPGCETLALRMRSYLFNICECN